jgi:haloalkane dehalogenase
MTIRLPLPDYPFTPKRFDVRPGIAMSYLDEGPRDGEVVVMLHGNPSWSFYWRKLVLGLRDRYRCVVPDHIGMGLNRPTTATVTRCNPESMTSRRC